MPQVFRWFLGRYNGSVTPHIDWDHIDWNSKAGVVNASEGPDVSQVASSAEPARFVGNATITAQNIAPRAGGLSFRIFVDRDEPLPRRVDIHVFDEDIAGFLRSSYLCSGELP